MADYIRRRYERYFRRENSEVFTLIVAKLNAGEITLNFAEQTVKSLLKEMGVRH